MIRTQSNSSIGVLLLDGHLRLLHNTPEAAIILEYPRKPQPNVALDKVLPAIRSSNLNNADDHGPSIAGSARVAKAAFGAAGF
jgi:hypothetical protein